MLVNHLEAPSALHIVCGGGAKLKSEALPAGF